MAVSRKKEEIKERGNRWENVRWIPVVSKRMAVGFKIMEPVFQEKGTHFLTE